MPMNALFVALWCSGAVAIALTSGRPRSIAYPAAAALFASAAGLLLFRVIYDLIGLPHGLFRSNLTGILGLICGTAAFIKAIG
jgi:hypothetical protein